MQCSSRVIPVVVGLFVAILLYLLSQGPMVSYPDSQGYIAISHGMVRGDFWTTQDGPTLPLTWAVRTPGYPLLLIPSIFFSPAGAEMYVRALHAGLGGLAAGVLTLAAPLGSSLLGAVATGGAFLAISRLVMPLHFRCVLTEWSAFCVLVISLALLLRFLRARRVKELFAWTATTVCAVLIRPVLIVALALPLVGGGMLRPPTLIRGLGAVLSGAVLLVCWLGFNTYRFGTPSLTPFLGYNLFGVAAFLPPVDPAALSPGVARAFGAAFLEKRAVPPDLTLPFSPGTPWSRVLTTYNHNIHRVAAGIARDLGLTAQETNRVLLEYAWAAIKEAPRSYIAYVEYTGTLFLREGALDLAATLLVLVCCMLRRLREQAFLIGAALFLHLSVIASTSLVETFLIRYHRPTIACCWLFTALGAAVLFGTLWPSFVQRRARAEA